MKMILSGTVKQVIQQINSLIAYYGENALLCDVIKQEAKSNE